MLILNCTRRERVDMAQAGRTIPASKTGGGIGVYGAGVALYQWCLIDWDDARIEFLILENESSAGGGALPEAQKALGLRPEVADYTEYEDVTERVLQKLASAEAAATPEDFHGTEFDMGVPVDYIQRLHRIWQERVRPGESSKT